jgi:hypothetical protein
MRKLQSHADDLYSVLSWAFGREIKQSKQLQYLHFFIFLLFPLQFLEGKLELFEQADSKSPGLHHDPSSSFEASRGAFHAFSIEKVVC